MVFNALKKYKYNLKKVLAFISITWYTICIVVFREANQGIEINFATNVIVYFYIGDSNELKFEKLKRQKNCM